MPKSAKQIRQEKGLHVYDVSYSARMSCRDYAKIENGIAAANLSERYAIAKALGVRADEINWPAGRFAPVRDDGWGPFSFPGLPAGLLSSLYDTDPRSLVRARMSFSRKKEFAEFCDEFHWNSGTIQDFFSCLRPFKKGELEKLATALDLPPIYLTHWFGSRRIKKQTDEPATAQTAQTTDSSTSEAFQQMLSGEGLEGSEDSPGD